MNAVPSRLEFMNGPELSAAVEAVATERRQSERTPVKLTGRLAYGGLNPGLVGCDIIDVSENGIRVETYTVLHDAPEFFSVEFADIYCRARRRWVKDKEMGLEFIYD